MSKPFIALVSIAIAATFIYKSIVPSSTAELGNLKMSTATEIIFKENHWKDHGYVYQPIGKTHFYFLGPEDGKRIVFVHGISTPAPAIGAFLENLAEKGYRVLCYDLYGRGYSDSPGTIYNEELFINQLASLLKTFDWNGVTLMGYSLGGGITVEFVSKYPKLIENVILISPAGVMESFPQIAKILKIPILGTLFIHLFGRKILAQAVVSEHILPVENGSILEKYNQIQVFHIWNHPGLCRAIYSTAVNFDFIGKAEHFKSLENTHKGKVLCFWGDRDSVTGFEKVIDYVPSINMIVKDFSSHNIVVEYPDFIADHIDNFLQT